MNLATLHLATRSFGSLFWGEHVEQVASSEVRVPGKMARRVESAGRDGACDERARVRGCEVTRSGSVVTDDLWITVWSITVKDRDGLPPAVSPRHLGGEPLAVEEQTTGPCDLLKEVRV